MITTFRAAVAVVLLAGFYSLFHEPSMGSELAKVVNAPEERSPYDLHPSVDTVLRVLAGRRCRRPRHAPTFPAWYGARWMIPGR